MEASVGILKFAFKRVGTPGFLFAPAFILLIPESWAIRLGLDQVRGTYRTWLGLATTLALAIVLSSAWAWAKARVESIRELQRAAKRKHRLAQLVLALDGLEQELLWRAHVFHAGELGAARTTSPEAIRNALEALRAVGLACVEFDLRGRPYHCIPSEHRATLGALLAEDQEREAGRRVRALARRALQANTPPRDAAA